MMPVVGHFAGGIDFADMKYVLSEAVVAADGTVEKPENAIMYGKWVNAIINLIIVGFVLFMIVKSYAKMRKKKEEAPAPDPGPVFQTRRNGSWLQVQLRHGKFMDLIYLFFAQARKNFH